MKKLVVLGFCTFFLLQINAQTSIYLEDFDTTPISMTASATSGGSSWSLTTSYQTSGTHSDSAQVQLGDTLILESDTFSTTGFTFVTLNFSQICKVDFFDKGIVEYSTDSGMTWTQLTSTDYLGIGFMSGNAFSAISYTAWNVGVSTAVPASSWWRNESFDLTAAANQTNVKVRFLLIDADNNGARSNYGWMIDDVEILGSPCELIPPSITLTGTIYQGAVFGTGPYTIQADIQDASGIASASLDYTVNGGSTNTLSMTLQSGTTYQAIIPAATVGDTICYTVHATDNTTCSNMAQFPATCNQFIINPNAPPNCLGNPVSIFNYAETFATFTPGNGTNTVGTLQNDWANSTADTHDWWVYNQGTRSANTGPSADHSPGDANYMYVEASGSFSNETAILNTPCYNLSGLIAPKFSFWYHMFGNNMGDLHIDLYDGNGWILDITPAIIGNQGNSWLFREVNLSAYTGTIVQLRFRALTGPGFQSDIAIDDIEIIEPIPIELSLSTIVTPNATSCNGSANEIVTLKIENLGSLAVDTIPVAYQVNNGPVIIDTAFFNLVPQTDFNHTIQQTFNMSMSGTYNIDAWIALPTDGNTSNDSILGYTVSTNSVSNIFPDTTTFDNFTVGTPGTFLNGWGNDPSNTFDWFVDDRGTPSFGTGPSGDTSTISGLGNYIYYEATNVPQGEEGSFFSRCFDINNTNRPELKFYYHMFGPNMGELHLDLNINGFLIKDIIPAIIGDQGNQWNLQMVDLTPYKGDIRVIFRAVRGSGFQSDIAVDEVLLYDLQPVGLNELDANEFNAYPNPVSNELNIQLISTSRVDIYNILGVQVLSTQMNAGRSVINTSDWKEGVYFVTVQNETGTNVQKIIKR